MELRRRPKRTDLPPVPAGHRRAVILLALAGHTGPSRPSVRTLRDRLTLPGRSVPSTSTVLADLEALRAEGLVDWEPGRDGSLRAIVGIAAVSREQLPPS